MSIATKQVIFIATLLAVPVAGYFVVFQPQNDRIAAAKREIDHKTGLLAKLREATALTDDLGRENAEIATAIKALEARLPTDEGIDEVLRDVHRSAEQSGMRLPKFRRLERNVGGGIAQEQLIELSLVGSFDAMYRFLLKLEQLPRITRVMDMKLVREEEPDGTVEAVATISVFYAAPVASAEGANK